jgi:hypothetical protein
MPFVYWLRRIGAAMAALAVLATGCTRSTPAASQQWAGRPLAAQYLRIADAGNRRLETDFDGLEKRDSRNLTAARADLRDAAATERLFDRRLMAIAFPPAIEQVARRLFRLNEARARLTAAVAAAATSLKTLRSYEHMLEIANQGVEQEVRAIRRHLGLPPPETS